MSAGVEETLGREARDATRAGAAAILGGLLTFAGGVLTLLVLNNGPGIEEYVGVLDALEARLAGRPVGETLLVQQVEYFGGRIVPLILGTVLTALGTALTAYALLHLFLAARARNPALGRAGLIAIVSAGVLFPVGHLVRYCASWIGAAGFADGQERTAQAARDVFTTPTVAAGSLLEFVGTFVLALAFFFTALNAMRVGLLTRFMGVLGIIVGALVVLPLDQPQVVRSFWLVALGVLVLGRWPGGRPPAWQTGQAEPWPTQQQLREARAAGGGRPPAPVPAGGYEPEPDPRPTAVAVSGDRSAAGPQRRKRKRRR